VSSTAEIPTHADTPIAPVARRAASMGVSARRPSTVLSIAMLGCLLYFLLPIFWLVVASTKDNSGLFSSFGLWFADEMNLLQNMHDVFTGDRGAFSRWMVNSAVYSGVSAVGATLLSALAGYAFAKYRFPGGSGLFSTVLGAIMIPSTALAIPTFLLFSQAGLTDTPWAVILPSMVNPLGVYLMKVYAEGAIDNSLLEAGRIDGAGEFRIFWQLCMRLLAPGMVTVLLFSLVATWNNYFLPLIMLNNPDLFPVTVGLTQWQAAATRGGGGANAMFSMVITGSLVSTVPLMVIFLALQRYWQSGLTAGAVKG
jgi:multiple sugar transport system permease protein